MDNDQGEITFLRMKLQELKRENEELMELCQALTKKLEVLNDAIDAFDELSEREDLNEDPASALKAWRDATLACQKIRGLVPEPQGVLLGDE